MENIMRYVPMGATAALAVSAILTPLPTGAQVPDPLEVGDVAPEFSLPGATRYGVLADPVSLSDYEGKTVVLSFFFRARTKG